MHNYKRAHINHIKTASELGLLNGMYTASTISTVQKRDGQTQTKQKDQLS